MKKRRWLKTLAVMLLAAMVIVAGCSQSSDNGGAPTPQEGGKPAGGDDQDQETINLSFGHFRVNNAGIDKLFLDTLDQYRAENPHVNLTEEAVAHDPYREKMTTLGASGELPDIFMANGSMIIDYQSKGYVMDWNDIIAEDTEWSEGFVDGAFDDFTIDGKVYGVSIKMDSVHTIYYNKEIFADAGIDEFPTTWEGFKEAIVKLKEAGYTPIGMGNRSNVPVGSTLFSTLADRVTGTEWFEGLKTGESAFTDEEFIQALEALQELVELGAFNPDINSIDEGQGESLYYNKQAAMHISGSWFLNRLLDNAPEDIIENTGFALLPAIDGGKGEAFAVAGGGGWSYAINSKLTGAEREAAIEIVKALSDADFAKAQKELGEFPARTVTDYDQSKLLPKVNEYTEFLDGVTYTPIYDIRLEPALVELVYQGVQELLIGVTEPEQIAERVQSAVE